MQRLELRLIGTMRKRHPIDQDVVNVLVGFSDAVCAARVCLRIHIDQEYRALRCSKACGQVYGGGGLTNAALLIHNCDDIRA